MLTMEQILNGTIDPTEFAIDHLGLDLISSDVEVIFDIGTGDQTFAKEAINKGFARAPLNRKVHRRRK